MYCDLGTVAGILQGVLECVYVWTTWYHFNFNDNNCNSAVGKKIYWFAQDCDTVTDSQQAMKIYIWAMKLSTKNHGCV